MRHSLMQPQIYASSAADSALSPLQLRSEYFEKCFLETQQLGGSGRQGCAGSAKKNFSLRFWRCLRDLCGLTLCGAGRDYFGGSGSILSRMRMVSSITLPTICKLFGLSLSTVSWVVCQKTSL